MLSQKVGAALSVAKRRSEEEGGGEGGLVEEVMRAWWEVDGVGRGGKP